MATRAKKSGGKSRRTSAARGKKGGTKRAQKVARSRGGASSRKSSGKSTSRRPAARSAAAKTTATTKRSAKAPAIKRAAAKPPAANASKPITPDGTSPIARVKRVAQKVAQQAQTAVVEGVETLRDLGGSLVERVTS